VLTLLANFMAVHPDDSARCLLLGGGQFWSFKTLEMAANICQLLWRPGHVWPKLVGQALIFRAFFWPSSG